MILGHLYFLFHMSFSFKTRTPQQDHIFQPAANGGRPEDPAQNCHQLWGQKCRTPRLGSALYLWTHTWLSLCVKCNGSTASAVSGGPYLFSFCDSHIQRKRKTGLQIPPRIWKASWAAGASVSFSMNKHSTEKPWTNNASNRVWGR